MSLTFFLRRLSFSFVALGGLMVLVFVLVRLTGSPVDLFLPLDANDAMRRALAVRLGLEDPIYVQFARWLADISRLDLGMSLWHSRPAADVVFQALPQTLLLGAVVLGLGSLAAIVVGALAAFRPYGAFDRIASAASLMGASIPDFWIGLMGILVFSVSLGWLPTSGYGSPSYWVLPVATLFFRPFGVLVQIVRGAMIAALNAPYIRTARAKGAANRRVIFIHALRNALLPMITVAGDLAVQLAGGVTVIETVFGWPGIGKLMIDAILQRDFAVLQAGILAVAVVIFAINIAIDFAYAAIDPRVRIDK
ncbi:MAG: ABC transporter permease [Telmatospirillum sp.]|nr:ABC transporter permease [Telmatospirillum sp.]